MCSANFWPVGIFVKEYEAKKKKIRSKEVGNPFKEPSKPKYLISIVQYIFHSAFITTDKLKKREMEIPFTI